MILGKGMYGVVETYKNDQVVKKINIFENANTIASNNIFEAIFCKRVQNKVYTMKNNVNIKNVTLNTDKKNEIHIYMEKGETLHEYIYSTTYLERMNNLENILLQLAIGLNEIHKYHYVHCDLKPANVIITNDKDVKIIDYGNMRYTNSNNLVLCTYSFCAPEFLLQERKPSKTCDAYSLGALMYFYIFKSNLYDEKKLKEPEDIKEFFDTQLDCDKINMYDCPDLCPKHIFEIIIGLIDKCPKKRMTVKMALKKLKYDPSPPESFNVLTFDEKYIGRFLNEKHELYLLMKKQSYRMFIHAIYVLELYGEVGTLTPEVLEAIKVIINCFHFPDNLYEVEDERVRQAIIDVLEKLEFNI